MKIVNKTSFEHGAPPGVNEYRAPPAVYTQNISILLYKFVKFAVNKRFDTINFPFTRNDRVWKMRFESRFCYRGEAEVVNPA